MNTPMNFAMLEHSLCVEPKVGRQLLPFYPEFLSSEQKAQFELHLEGCEYCQESWELWRTTGLAVRIGSFLEYACELLTERRIDEAIAAYNHAIEIDPTIIETDAGRQFFLAESWLALTAAQSKEQDILAYLAPTYSPVAEAMAAAKPVPAFPVLLEYAHGAVKAKITALGKLVYCELLSVSAAFESGVRLLGKVCSPAPALTVWAIPKGQKQQIGTLETLFGSAKFPDVVKTLRTFRMLPL